MSQDKPFKWKSSLGGTISCVGQSLLGLQGGSNSVNQVDGVSDMAPTCQLYGSVQGGFRKEAMAFARLDARHFSFSVYATGDF